MSNVQNLKIYDIIEQFEDLIENSPRPKLSGNATKRIVDVDEIFDLLGDLKTTIPEDIRRANGIIAEARTMRNNAEDHARDVVAEAEQQAAATIADAQGKASQIVAGMREHGINAVHTPTFDDTEAYLRAHWQPGDLVLTSSMGGNYPSDLVVGSIESIHTDASGISRYAVIAPAADLDSLVQVFIIKDFDIVE